MTLKIFMLINLVALGYSFKSQSTALYNTFFLYGLFSILTAGRIKPTAFPKDRPKKV